MNGLLGLAYGRAHYDNQRGKGSAIHFKYHLRTYKPVIYIRFLVFVLEA
jgi:hypothetical protein